MILLQTPIYYIINGMNIINMKYTSHYYSAFSNHLKSVNRGRIIIFFLTCFLLLGGVGIRSSKAQESPIIADFEHFYEDFKLSNLSKLYWKLGILDINNETHINNFLFINECDIYRDYHNNEFEWRSILRKAQLSIKNNVDSFPTRFKFVQPLRMSVYDFKNKVYGIQDKFKIDGIRRFEVRSQNYNEQVCTQRQLRSIMGYPKSVVVEINQPFILENVPMSPVLAKSYADSKLAAFNELREIFKTRESMLSLRDAYLVMKVRFYSYRGDERVDYGQTSYVLNAILEGYEIYQDENLTRLLYFRNYLRDNKDKSIGDRLRREYEELNSGASL